MFLFHFLQSWFNVCSARITCAMVRAWFVQCSLNYERDKQFLHTPALTQIARCQNLVCTLLNAQTRERHGTS
jgi:hypothetical protein